MTIFKLEHLPPIHHLLNGHELEWDADLRHLKIKYTALESFTNPRGTVEGGMLCAMLDDAMGILAGLNQAERPATTINLSLDFFRPCQVGVVETHAYFIKEGQKILNLESEAWQDNKLIAKSSAAFMVL